MVSINCNLWFSLLMSGRVGSGLSVSGSGRVGFKIVGFLSGRVEFSTKLQPSSEQQQREAPKSEGVATPDESAPTFRSSKSRRRQRERQQSKNSKRESVGGPNSVGDVFAGGVLDGSRELSLADSTRGLNVSSTRT